MSDPKNFIADTSKELVKPIYDDLAHPCMEESGKLLGRLPRAINAALANIDKWILKKEFNVKETKRLLELKLQNVNIEKIVPPEPYVAVPAFQAISYSMDSEELRNLYANLLAHSLNSDEKEKVHPSFVEIIKGLSPLDCRVFNYIMTHNLPAEDGIIGCINLRVRNKDTSTSIEINGCFTEIPFSNQFLISSSLDNLRRNTLISNKNSIISENIFYDRIISNTHYSDFKNDYIKTFNHNVEELLETRSLIKSTSFGNDFYNICVKDPV